MPTETEHFCPFCGVEFEAGADACPSCDLPLLSPERIVAANGRARTHARNAGATHGSLLAIAGRPRPEYAAGRLCRVTRALNQAEAEMLEDMLRTEGIPCVVRRSARADTPDFGAAGQREILVPEGGLAAARAVLNIAERDAGRPAAVQISTAAVAIALIALAALAVAVLLAFG